MLNNVRARLILLFVVLMVIQAVILGILITQQASNTLQQQAVESQGRLARQAAIHLEAFFNERQNELFVLTDVYGLDILDPDAQKDVLLTLLDKQSAYYKLMLVDADGQEILRLARGEIVTADDLTSRADDPLFQTAMETNTVSFSPIYFDEGARDRLITMAVPVEDLFTGEIGHVLIAYLRFQDIEETVLRDLTLAEGEDVYILDNGGVVIAHRNPSLVLNETVFNLPATDGQHTGLSGNDAVLAMDTIQLGDLGLTVVAEASYAHVTTLASDLTKLAIIIAVVTIVAACVLVALEYLATKQ